MVKTHIQARNSFVGQNWGRHRFIIVTKLPLCQAQGVQDSLELYEHIQTWLWVRAQFIDTKEVEYLPGIWIVSLKRFAKQLVKYLKRLDVNWIEVIISNDTKHIITIVWERD